MKADEWQRGCWSRARLSVGMEVVDGLRRGTKTVLSVWQLSYCTRAAKTFLGCGLIRSGTKGKLSFPWRSLLGAIGGRFAPDRPLDLHLMVYAAKHLLDSGGHQRKQEITRIHESGKSYRHLRKKMISRSPCQCGGFVEFDLMSVFIVRCI